MIQLPRGRKLRRVFLEDKKVSSLVVRAEGGRTAVAQRNYKKLRKALEEYRVLKGSTPPRPYVENYGRLTFTYALGMITNRLCPYTMTATVGNGRWWIRL